MMGLMKMPRTEEPDRSYCMYNPMNCVRIRSSMGYIVRWAKMGFIVIPSRTMGNTSQPASHCTQLYFK